MRYSASDKTEIIRLVEQSPWPALRTERWKSSAFPDHRFTGRMIAYPYGGPEVTRGSPPSRPDRIPWNRIPEAVRCRMSVDLALDQPELSPRELAVALHGRGKILCLRGLPVYRLLKAHDLITSPAYIVIKAAEAFKDKTSWRPTSSGRPTSPISRSRAGAGTISPPCSTTSRA